MRHGQFPINQERDEADLMDRVEDALTAVNPDLWLAALALVLAVGWLGRLA